MNTWKDRSFDGATTTLTFTAQSATRRIANILIAKRRSFAIRSLPGDVWKVDIEGEWPTKT